MSVYQAVSKTKKVRPEYAVNGRMLIKTDSSTQFIASTADTVTLSRLLSITYTG